MGEIETVARRHNLIMSNALRHVLGSRTRLPIQRAVNIYEWGNEWCKAKCTVKMRMAPSALTLGSQSNDERMLDQSETRLKSAVTSFKKNTNRHSSYINDLKVQSDSLHLRKAANIAASRKWCISRVTGFSGFRHDYSPSQYPWSIVMIRRPACINNRKMIIAREKNARHELTFKLP